MVKSGPFAVFVPNLRYHLAQFSKDCRKCSTQKLKKYSSTLHSSLTNVANPNYTSLFKHISLDILGPIFIRSTNNNKVKVWLLFIIDVMFYTVDFFHSR